METGLLSSAVVLASVFKQEGHKQHEAQVSGANFKPGPGPGDHLHSWHRPHYPGQHPAPPLTLDRLQHCRTDLPLPHDRPRILQIGSGLGSGLNLSET